MEQIIAERIPEWKYPNFKEKRDEALRIYMNPKDHKNKNVLNLAISKVNFFSNIIFIKKFLTNMNLIF